MGKDIKELIGGIIDNTNNSYPTSGGNVNTTNPTLSFDKGAFREKLSLAVLRDIVHAMMDDDYEDMDGMIDKSIINHIDADYNGSCYDYLCKSRDATKSPMIGDIIQEIEDKVEDAAEKAELTKEIPDDALSMNDTIDYLDLEKNVDNYAQFREEIKKKVSNKIINSVAAELIGNNDAPKFKDNLDASLKKKRDETNAEDAEKTEGGNGESDLQVGPENTIQPMGESVIITATGKIYAESARMGEQRSFDDCMNEAILEYALTNLDFCWKQHTKNNFHDKYIYKK